jgi:hypothetical protein
MMPQVVGMHAAGTNQTQPTGLTHCRGQLPAAAPNHPTLNNGILDSKNLTNPVFHNGTNLGKNEHFFTFVTT